MHAYADQCIESSPAEKANIPPCYTVQCYATLYYAVLRYTMLYYVGHMAQVEPNIKWLLFCKTSHEFIWWTCSSWASIYSPLLGPESRSPGADECSIRQEPAVAEEEKTQGLLHICGLQGLEGRSWELAAGQYGPDLPRCSSPSTKHSAKPEITKVTLDFCLPPSSWLNILGRAFMAQLLRHSGIYCSVMTVAWTFSKDPAATLEEREEGVNEEQENNFMALAIALWR